MTSRIRDAPSLTPEEEVRLGRYIQAIEGVTYKKNGTARYGSLADYFDLVSRSKEKTSYRTRFVKTFESTPGFTDHLSTVAQPSDIEERYMAALEHEIEDLKSYSIFGEYRANAIAEIGVHLESVTEEVVFDEITGEAPRLTDLLRRLCSNSSKTAISHIRSRILSVLSIICFTRHQRLCNFLPAVMGLMLFSAGTNKQIFSITNSMGWTESWRSIYRSVGGLQESARNLARRFISDGPWAVVYDNCELTTGVSEQDDVSRNQLHSITTALLLPGTNLPINGLAQGDFRPYSITMEDMVRTSVVGSQCITQCTTAALYRALEEVYPDFIRGYKSTNRIIRDHAAYPVVDRISMPEGARHVPIPLMPIQTSENTTSGNIEILQNIFREQLALSDEYFDQGPAIIVGGDAKTVNRMWSAIHGVGDNIDRDCRLEHIVPAPGLFHVQMHIIATIMKTHWGEEPASGDRCNHAALRYLSGKMARRFVSPTNMVFAHARTFVLDALQGRMVAEFYRRLIRGSPFSRSGPLNTDATATELEEAVTRLTARELKKLVNKTVDSITNYHLEGPDLERRENLLFIRDAMYYEALTHGIKRGDIGIIRYVVNDLIYMFEGSKKPTYTRIAMYIKKLIDTAYVKSEEHRRAIAGTLLVNPTGRPDGFYPIDLANEFLNRSIKDIWSSRKTSSTTVRTASEYGALDAIFLRPLRVQFQSVWGRNSLGKHERKNRGRVINYLAIQSQHSIAPDSRRDNPVSQKLKWSKDIILDGSNTIESTMDAFNTKFKYEVDNEVSTEDIPIWDIDAAEVLGSLSLDESTVDMALVEELNALPSPPEELLEDIEEGL